METRVASLVLVFILLFSTFSAVSGEPVCSPIVYSRDQLLALSTVAMPPHEQPDVPRQLRRRRRGTVPERFAIAGGLRSPQVLRKSSGPLECRGHSWPVVASAIFYGVVCWSSNISAADRRRLDKLNKKASSILGCPLDPVQVVRESRKMNK